MFPWGRRFRHYRRLFFFLTKEIASPVPQDCRRSARPVHASDADRRARAVPRGLSKVRKRDPRRRHRSASQGRPARSTPPPPIDAPGSPGPSPCGLSKVCKPDPRRRGRSTRPGRPPGLSKVRKPGPRLRLVIDPPRSTPPPAIDAPGPSPRSLEGLQTRSTASATDRRASPVPQVCRRSARPVHASDADRRARTVPRGLSKVRKPGPRLRRRSTRQVRPGRPLAVCRRSASPIHASAADRRARSARPVSRGLSKVRPPGPRRRRRSTRQGQVSPDFLDNAVFRVENIGSVDPQDRPARNPSPLSLPPTVPPKAVPPHKKNAGTYRKYSAKK